MKEVENLIFKSYGHKYKISPNNLLKLIKKIIHQN